MPASSSYATRLLAVDTEYRLRANRDGGAVGVDLGVKSLATFSDGTIAPALKPRRAEHKRMVRLSRSLARKQKGSANRNKAKTGLARFHLRIANVRKDALHKVTTTLAPNYSTIGIEDLNVAGMLRNGSGILHRRCRVWRVPPSTRVQGLYDRRPKQLSPSIAVPYCDIPDH
jgi:transposase